MPIPNNRWDNLLAGLPVLPYPGRTSLCQDAPRLSAPQDCGGCGEITINILVRRLQPEILYEGKGRFAAFLEFLGIRDVLDRPLGRKVTPTGSSPGLPPEPTPSPQRWTVVATLCRRCSMQSRQRLTLQLWEPHRSNEGGLVAGIGLESFGRLRTGSLGYAPRQSRQMLGCREQTKAL